MQTTWDEEQMTGSERVARRVSQVLSPPLIVAVVFGIAFYHLLHLDTYPLQTVVLAFLVAILFGSLVPIGLTLYGYHSGRISDLDISIRSERPRIFIYCLISFVIGDKVLGWLGAPFLVQELFYAMVLGTTVFFLMTFLTKLSLHVGTVTGGMMLLPLVFREPRSAFYASILLVPWVVGWARVRLTRHSWTQVTLGWICAILAIIVAIHTFPFVSAHLG